MDDVSSESAADGEFDGPPIVEIVEAIRREGAPVPRRVGQSVLGDGRLLGWAEYGHPDGDPVLWFHGTPGARNQVPPSINQAALQQGFRVLTVERPGTGVSTDHRYRRVAEFGPDIESLVDDLGLDRFAVVGLSGGGPYTLSVAHHLPDRVVAASLLGGLGPTRGPDAVWSYTRALRFVAPAFEVIRSPAGAALAGVIDALAPVADPVFSAYVALLGFADKPVLRDPQFKAMFLQDLLDAHQLRSVAHDMALFARHWGFTLDEVRPPVVVWQGLNDTIVPPSHGHHQASRLPRGELRVRPGEGHFAGFADVATVLHRLREVWAGESVVPVDAGPS
ncbi:MAG: alpha/beta hydrolase [Actinobacteria bacterium]|nr:alpha/beta hydrolase [Actinomycetota bacterium]